MLSLCFLKSFITTHASHSSISWFKIKVYFPHFPELPGVCRRDGHVGWTYDIFITGICLGFSHQYSVPRIFNLLQGMRRRFCPFNDLNLRLCKKVTCQTANFVENLARRRFIISIKDCIILCICNRCTVTLFLIIMKAVMNRKCLT